METEVACVEAKRVHDLMHFYGSVDRRCHRIGELDGALGAWMLECLDVAPLTTDASIADAQPTLLMGEGVARSSEEDTRFLREAFAAGAPIVLLQASAAQIDALHDVLASGQRCAPPTEGWQAAAYAIRQRSDGVLAQSTFHRCDEASESGGASALDRGEAVRLQDQAGALAEWVLGPFPDLPPAPVEALDDGRRSLTDLISAWVDVQQWTNYYGTFQISSFAWVAHAVAPKEDYFYLQQKCVFRFNYKVRSGLADFWHRKIDWFDDDRHALGDFPRAVSYEYPLTYEIECQPVGLEARPDLATIVQSAPPTSQGSSTWTIGVSWSVGGNVVAGIAEQGVGVNAGVSVSNSQTITVNDVSVLNRSLTTANNAHVVYEMPLARSSAGDRCFNRLSQPVPVQRGTFQPQNDTIWKTTAALRDGRTHFRVRVTLSYTHASSSMASWPVDSNPPGDCNIFTCDCAARSTTHRISEDPYFLNIPLPATKPRG